MATIKVRLTEAVESVREDPKRLIYLVGLGLLLFWLLRGCIPGLGGTSLPAQVSDDLQRIYVTCISAEDTPVWPGEPRQPECGRINVGQVDQGVMSEQARATGITQAICYKISIDNPRWQTMGQTRHEVLWFSRSYSKVAVLQNGEWKTFTDEDKQDEQRWQEFGCPGTYEN